MQVGNAVPAPIAYLPFIGHTSGWDGNIAFSFAMVTSPFVDELSAAYACLAFQSNVRLLRQRTVFDLARSHLRCSIQAKHTVPTNVTTTSPRQIHQPLWLIPRSVCFGPHRSRTTTTTPTHRSFPRGLNPANPYRL